MISVLPQHMIPLTDEESAEQEEKDPRHSRFEVAVGCFSDRSRRLLSNWIYSVFLLCFLLEKFIFNSFYSVPIVVHFVVYYFSSFFFLFTYFLSLSFLLFIFQNVHFWDGGPVVFFSCYSKANWLYKQSPDCFLVYLSLSLSLRETPTCTCPILLTSLAVWSIYRTRNPDVIDSKLRIADSS